MYRLRLLLTLLCLSLISAGARAAAADGLMAEWNFDEGKGNIAHDSSGNGHDATLHGAAWVKQGDGFALRLEGKGDYVDCGKSSDIGIGGPVTLETWIKPLHKDMGEVYVLGEGFSTYVMSFYVTKLGGWYINGGDNHIYGTLTLGRWNHWVGTFDGEKQEVWVNGRLAARRESKYKTYKPSGIFRMGSKFEGMLDRVRVYNYAIPEEDIAGHFKREAGEYGFDTTWFKRVKTKLYSYLERGEVVVEVDYKGLQPFKGKGRLEVTLANKENPAKILERKVLEEVRAKQGFEEVTLPCDKLAAGDYLIRVKMRDEKNDWPVEELTFSYPARQKPVVSPDKKTVAPLPPKREPTPFDVKVGKGGGFTITIKDGTYPFESRVSWPNGDFNRLSAGDEPFARGEKSWKTRVQATGKNSYTVNADGDFYTIRREIGVFKTHVYVKDTYTNTTGEDLGLLIYNDTPVKPGQVVKSLLSGFEKRGRKEETRIPDYGPTVFFTDANAGMGIIPIDDVFVVQALPYIEWQDRAGVGTEKFALAPGASYTLEWAVYPTGSRDYYDFINNFRTVEGRIGTIKEAPGFTVYGPCNRRQVPTRDFLDKRGIKIGIFSNLGDPVDDPDLDIEGIEFVDFPKEMELLRRQAAAVHRRLPGFKAVFHIAHSLYTTNDPDRFKDSRVILPNGKQATWGDGSDFGPEKKAAGWKWWIFYPTPGNSFHDAMMRSVDVMMDDMGWDGAFMDGFLAGYISRWTYDGRWDGHSAQIDLNTKTIKRKMGSVILLSQPSMIEYARKIRDKGGVVIANNTVFTRSIANEKYIIFDQECASGPQLHTAPVVTALRGSSAAASSEKEIYRDMLEKLKWGECFIYFNERIPLTYPSLAAREFPITFEEIRSGMIKGPERIITMNPGVYGWRGKRDLHLVYKFDERGAPAAHDYITTVDKHSVRTELHFQENESAVIEPIPVSLTTDTPVNLRVLRYEGNSLTVRMNGRGQATLDLFVGTFYPDVRDGVFTDGGVNPADVGVGTPYRVTVGGVSTTIADRNGTLIVPLKLDGEVEIIIKPAQGGE